MEIFAHTLWTTAGVKVFNDSRKEKTKKISFVWSAFWGLFPDIFSLSLPIVIFAIGLIMGDYGLGSLPHTREVINSYNISLILYPMTHSLVIWGFVFGIVWIVMKRPPLVMLGWVFHIILDMPSHPMGVFATPLFYPLSNYKFQYGVSWASTSFFIINYSVLSIIWGIILFKKYIKKKKFI